VLGRSEQLGAERSQSGQQCADVAAHAGTIEHRFGVDEYVAFLSEFDEESLFDELEAAARERLESTLREELARLTPDEMTMRFPIVFARGRRSR